MSFIIKTRLFKILIIFVCLTFLSIDSVEAKDTKRPEPIFSVTLKREFDDAKAAFEQAKEYILENYYSPTLTEDTLYWAAIKGMLRHISPPNNPDYSKLFTPEEFDKLSKILAGTDVSLGIKSQFNNIDGSLTVTEVIPGSPADGKLKPLDRIVRIDGQELKSKSIQAVNKMLEGEKDKRIRLKIVRDIRIFDVTLTLKNFKTPNMRVYTLPNKIALIEIKKITKDITENLKKELDKLKKENIRKVIIDLRNNPGGLLAEALKMIELFLPEKRIVLRMVTKETKDHNKVVTVNPEVFDGEIVILINSKTASSGEVFAVALKDHKRALIVGSTTFGKSFIDKNFLLPNKYRIQFITGAMYSPLGQSWFAKGIQPEIVINQDEKLYKELLKLDPKDRLDKDLPLLAAYNFLNKSGK